MEQGGDNIGSSIIRNAIAESVPVGTVTGRGECNCDRNGDCDRKRGVYDGERYSMSPGVASMIELWPFPVLFDYCKHVRTRTHLLLDWTAIHGIQQDTVKKEYMDR